MTTVVDFGKQRKPVTCRDGVVLVTETRRVRTGRGLVELRVQNRPSRVVMRYPRIGAIVAHLINAIRYGR